MPTEKLDGPAVRALGVRSRKLSNVLVNHRMGDQNLLSRAPPCFGGTLSRWSQLHLQSLAPTPVSNRVDVRQAAGRKTNYRIFITT
jgi:hypothetical protein